MIRTALIAAVLLSAAPALAQSAPVGTRPAPAATPVQPVKTDARLDINTATIERLLSVKGLTKTQAEAIVLGRPFKSVDELAASNILPAEVFAKVKDQLMVTK